MFIFQRITAPVKRRSEEEGNGAGMSKRARSLTCPSLPSWPRKGPNDNSRRVRSISLSVPPPLPVSPRAKAKGSLARLPVLAESGQWGSPSMPHHSRLLQRVSHAPARPRPRTAEVCQDSAEDLSRDAVALPSSDSSMEQQTLPQASRTLLQTPANIAGSFQFVFGENMSERVLSPQKSPHSEEMSETDCSSADSDSSSSEDSNTMTVHSTLWESAAAYTNVGRRRYLPKQVQVFTGEENESNVVQLTCKLFVLERGTQSWRERGRGVLRLNDLKRGAKGCLQSRMVMRHEGNLKVILNTKLYAHTQLRRPARRSLQVTATDVESRSVRVFLIQASARDVARLHVAVHHRLVALRCSSRADAPGGGATAAAAAILDWDCSSEEEGEDEEEKAEEEAVLITHVRSGDCKWRPSRSRLCP